MAKKMYMYDVFLSHSSKDKEFVRIINSKLHAEGIITFFDEANIPWGGNIPAFIEQAVDNSRHLILVLSPDAVESEWVDLERYINIFRSPNAEKRLILPLLLRDCKKIPAAIRLLRYLPVRNDREFEEAWPQILKALSPKTKIHTPQKKDSTSHLLESEGLYLIKLIINNGKYNLSESTTNLADIWLKKISDGMVFITTLRVLHIPGSCSATSSGKLPFEAKYSFTFSSGSYNEHILEPALAINPSDRDIMHFQIALTPIGSFPSTGGDVIATLLYHYENGTNGEIPLVQIPPEIELLSRVSNKILPIKFTNFNNIFEIIPSGAIKGVNTTIGNKSKFKKPLKFIDTDLVKKSFLNGLISALNDSDEKIRAWATWALGEIGEPKSLDALYAILQDPSYVVKKEAIFALKKIRDSRAVSHLVPLLKDRKSWIRQCTCRALGDLGDVKAIPALIDNLVEENSRGHTDKKIKLKMEWIEVDDIDGPFTKEKEEYLVNEDEELEAESTYANRKFWSLSGTQTIYNAVELSAAEALIQIGDKNICKELMPLTSSSYELVRKAVTYVLTNLGYV